MKLEIRHVEKKFGSERVLKGVNLPPMPCGCIAVIGPSGGGKSTLVRILAGLLVADAGEVLLDDRLMPCGENDLIAYRRKIGVVFQAYNLFPHLNAFENIALPLREVHLLKPVTAKERTMTLLRRFGLEHHAHKRPAELSGGQRQRVSIIRALSVEPQLLIFDEPTSALDPAMALEVLKTIEALKADLPMIIVTHHLAFARRVADQIFFISGGKLVEHGPAAELFASPATNELKDFLTVETAYA